MDQSKRDSGGCALKESLYLPVDGKSLPRQTQTVLFLLQYCGYDSFNISLIQTENDAAVAECEDLACRRKHPSCPDTSGLATASSEDIDHVIGPDENATMPSDDPTVFPDKPSAVAGHQPRPLDTKKPSSCDHQTGQQSTTSLPDFIPDHLLRDIALKNFQDMDWLAQQCQLPVIIGSGGMTCYTGLCTVLRRIIKKGHEGDPQKKLDALLGFNQACLKKCSEISPWTKLCEVDIYQDSDLDAADAIPETILELEKLLERPLVMSNDYLSKKNAQKGRVASLLERTASPGKVGDGPASPESDFFQTSSVMHIVDKREIRAAKNVYRKQKILRKQAEVASGSANSGPDRSNVGSSQQEPELSNPQNKVELLKSSDNSTSSLVDVEGRGAVRGEDSVGVGGSVEKTSSRLNEKASLGRTKTHKVSSTPPNAEQQTPPQPSPSPPDRRFLEGHYVTLTDFALFNSLHSYFQSCAEKGTGQDLLGNVPLVCRWYRRMWSVPNVRGCAEQCGLREVAIPEEVLQNGVRSEAVAEVKAVVKDETTAKTILDKMKSIKINIKTSAMDRVAGILSKLEACDIQVKVDDFPAENIQIPWDSFPADVDPSKDVSADRARHKRQQIESLVAAVKMVVKPRDVIVDFCSGGGHVGIALAHCLPDSRVVMVENNEESIKRAEARVSLHACGVATDLVLAKCLQSRASFVCSPCCYGSIRDSHLVQYPRSQKFCQSLLTYEDYLLVAHKAEQTSRNFDTDMAKQAKVCMSILDTDRAEAARGCGYQVRLCSLSPPTCSPKNNLLIGTASSCIRPSGY